MGSLFVVATPIGNLSDITKRAIDTLKEVDYILCEDTRTSSVLLNHCNIKNKLVSYHKFNENERADSVISDLKKGKNIALISDAGTPCINDPGYIIVKKARLENIPVFGVGGISALTTAISVSGLSSDIFTFHGFFPRENKECKRLIRNLSDSNISTHVFYESPKRIIKTLEILKDSFPDLKINVLKELTKLHEKSYYGSIEEVLISLKDDPKSTSGEYVFIIEKEINKKEEVSLSIESLLIDIMAKEKISLKEAIDILNKREENLSKKDIYNASLNLKDIL